MLVVLCSRSRSVDPSSSRKKNNITVFPQLKTNCRRHETFGFQHDSNMIFWLSVGVTREKHLRNWCHQILGFLWIWKIGRWTLQFSTSTKKKNMCKTNRIFCCTFPTIYKFSSVNKRSTCCPKYFPSFPKKKIGGQTVGCQSCPRSRE